MIQTAGMVGRSNASRGWSLPELNAEQMAAVEEHIRLAWRFARDFNRKFGGALDEQFSDAVVGLMRAVAVHDPARGALSTIAYRTCWHAMTRRYSEAKKSRDLMRKHGMRGILSTDGPMSAQTRGRALTLGDHLSQRREPDPVSRAEMREQEARVRSLVENRCRQDPRLAVLLRMRREGATLDEAADALGLSRGRTQQMESRMHRAAQRVLRGEDAEDL